MPNARTVVYSAVEHANRQAQYPVARALTEAEASLVYAAITHYRNRFEQIESEGVGDYGKVMAAHCQALADMLQPGTTIVVRRS